MEEDIQDSNPEFDLDAVGSEEVETPEVTEDTPQTPYSPESKSLNVSNPEEAAEAVSDIEVVGDPDLFTVLSKASSEKQGWMKSTKAMPVDGAGVLVQVTTQQRNADGTYAVAEALTFVPGVMIGSMGGNKCLVRK